MDVIVRRMAAGDVEGALAVQVASFEDYDRRMGETPQAVTPEGTRRQLVRLHHFLQHDACGSWVAVVEGRVVGVALALRRGPLWGLSLLLVDPGTQSSGVGRQLLDASLTYADGARLAVILSSADPRAMRRYASAGFDLHPQVGARGEVRARRLPPRSPRVRVGGPGDAALADRVDRAVRGAERGPDQLLLASNFPMWVVDDDAGAGYLYGRPDHSVWGMAATDERTATELLWQSLAAAADAGQPARVDHIAGNQQWAIRVAVEAGLVLQPSGPVFWRGRTPPPAYLPTGAYL